MDFGTVPTVWYFACFFVFVFVFFSFHFFNAVKGSAFYSILFNKSENIFPIFNFLQDKDVTSKHITYLKMWKQWLIFLVRINNCWSLRVSYYNNINSSHIFFRKNNVFIHERSVSPVSHWCMIGLIWNKDLDGHVKT